MRAAHVGVGDARRDELGRRTEDEHVPIGERTAAGERARGRRGALTREAVRQQERNESLERRVLPLAGFRRQIRDVPG